MSKADYTFLHTTNSILKEGVWDTEQKVRPKWSDGTPAHTAKLFAVNNVYKMSDGFPVSTLRFINWRAAIDEILWIWQQKDNNVHDLNSHIWDAWADENGSIGKAYGWQAGQKAKYPFGEADQIDMVRYYLKNQPAFRSMVTELFVHKDLHEMGLYPCVHGMQFDVADGKLNMFLNQRSNDTLAAGNWNVVQYAALLYMLAKEADLQPGTLSHMIVNSHIYDRHVPFVVHMTLARAKEIEDKLYELKTTPMTQLFTDEKERNEFESFMYKATYDILHEGEIEEAKSLERECDKYDTKFYQEYAKGIVETKAFKNAEFITETMLKHPEYEGILGYARPELLLDEKVTSFYDFKSPLRRNQGEGKEFVPNEESSFDMKDYDYNEHGIKFERPVPVAE